MISEQRGDVMKERLSIYHHTLGEADQYFVSRGYKVLFEIPRFIGKIFDYFYERRNKE